MATPRHIQEAAQRPPTEVPTFRIGSGLMMELPTREQMLWAIKRGVEGLLFEARYRVDENMTNHTAHQGGLASNAGRAGGLVHAGRHPLPVARGAIAHRRRTGRGDVAMATARKVEVKLRVLPEWLATIDAIAEVYTNERCDESNPEPFTREDVLLQCILRGLIPEEKENLGTSTTNPNERHACEPIEPSEHSDEFTNLMLALFAGAKELRARALKLHDRAENTCHDDEWEPTRAEFNHAFNADGHADVLLEEHKRMVERQWRFDQTPGAKKWRDEIHKQAERDDPELQLRGARQSAEHAQQRLREVEAKIKGKATNGHAHQNGTAS